MLNGDDVQKLILGEVGALAERGRPENGSNATINEEGRGATYALRRLKPSF